MSTYADSSKAHVWEDGDAFRAPKGTTMPTDFFAASLTGWEAFGGIRAGFEVEQTQKRDEYDIWNNKSGAAYKRSKGTTSGKVTLEPVDYSKATLLTFLRGGSIAAVGSSTTNFEMLDGGGEEFALIIRVYDGTAKKAYYIARGELEDLPKETMDGKDIEGFPIVVVPLAPSDGTKAIRRILNSNPLATS